MEADWEFEIGGDAPVIEAHWSGFVDLRADPARVAELVECRRLPGLADALVKLNGARSRLWTSKVDVFVPDRIDQDELDAAGDGAGSAMACYIDLLPREDCGWNSLSGVESNCRRICERLHVVKLRGCRVDLVIRRAYITQDKEGFGVTAYLTACGKEEKAAEGRHLECLAAFVDVLLLEE